MELVGFIIFALIIWLVFKSFGEMSATIKGKTGEFVVSATLGMLSRNEYIVLNDLMLKFGSYTSQIDHVVVSVYGIFVIETKNCKGWVYGSINKRYWTQNIWGNKYQLYNPVWQNESHIKALREALRGYDCRFIPAVVFIGTSSIRLYGDADCVLWRSELKDYIRNFDTPVMEFPKCQEIADLLKLQNVTDKEIKQRHKIIANNVRINKDMSEISGLCPKCGGQMVLKSGRYGQFYGCSNYPSCHYTHN